MSAILKVPQETNQDQIILPTNIGKIEVSDPTELELISQPWEVMIKPLDRNVFYHKKDFLMTPSTILYKESYSSAVQIKGLTPDRMLGFTIPLKLGRQSLYWNMPFNPDELPASMPGGIDVVLDAGQVHIMVLIKLSLLERLLTREQATTLKKAASKRQLPIAKQALASFTQWLLNLLSNAQQQADIYQNSSVLKAIEEDLLQHLLRVVRLPLQNSAKDSRQKRQRGFELAMEYIRETDLSSISVPEICNNAGISQRTLEYAFRENFNMTAVGFIKKLRLHSVRRILLTTHIGDGSITDTAYHHGIYEMGRFASNYKNHFGELPSQTLVKPPIDSSSTFIYFQ